MFFVRNFGCALFYLKGRTMKKKLPQIAICVSITIMVIIIIIFVCNNILNSIFFNDSDNNIKNLESTLAETVIQKAEKIEGNQGFYISSEKELIEVNEPEQAPEEISYLLNINSKKFHYLSCKSGQKTKDHNRLYFTGTKDQIIAKGFSPCKKCNP